MDLFSNAATLTDLNVVLTRPPWQLRKLSTYPLILIQKLKLMERAACLLFRCNDQVGIIAELVMFFRDSNVSICRFEEYTDSQYFFARLEWRGDHPWATATVFEEAFRSVASSFDNASFRAHFFENPQKLGLFSSKEPHALIEAINKCEAGDYPNTEISFLISNSSGLEKYAQRHDIPFYYIKTFQRSCQA